MEAQDKKLLTTTLVATGVGLILLYFVRRVMTPFFIAFALAYLLDPLVDRLEKWKLSRTMGVILLLILFFLITLAGTAILVPLFRVQAEHLAHNLPHYLTTLQDWARPLLQNIEWLEPGKIQEAMNEVMKKLGQLPVQLLGNLTEFLWSSLSSLFNAVLVAVNLFIIPVAMFYLLRDFDHINQKIANLVPPRLRESFVDMFREIDRVLSKFVRGQLMVATLMAALYSIGLFLCGTPMSLLLGVLAGYANLVPYLGLVFGFIPAALLTFLHFQEFGPILGVVAVFGVVQMLEGMVITPRVVGDQVGLHPVAIMLAVLIGAELFGLMGVFLAVPVAAVINVLMRRGVGWYKKSPAYT
ncbi:MAG: AI-2E family transporter [Nitrospinaceae bacterium]|nr:AI-2E family transporter [Nitrospinaceae bacterium]NIR55494.1 AI-2E family transporter [Nitrospinaceae bacterium]NIS85926.1 AI-2E family transporter [Nitrospinaceae bacterium]NIT82774.1 AI-2E family transporter [Nitrospinaceae bacterium]NIU44978.1 AI-2E family transporter [Nitrospinaceae bacterium]